MRKIDSINFVRLCGLYSPEAEEFTSEQTESMLRYAESLKEKYGAFNLRTDFPKNSEKKSMNLPFFKNCTFEQLKKIVEENKEVITYIIHQPIDDSRLICNGAGYLNPNKIFFAEINKTDKTTQREAMKIAHHLEQKIIGCGDNDEVLEKIRRDLIKNRIMGIVEFSVFEDGTPVYWQIRNKH